MANLLRPATGTPCGIVGPPAGRHVEQPLDVHPHALPGVPGACLATTGHS